MAEVTLAALRAPIVTLAQIYCIWAEMLPLPRRLENISTENTNPWPSESPLLHSD